MYIYIGKNSPPPPSPVQQRTVFTCYKPQHCPNNIELKKTKKLLTKKTCF